MLCVTVRTRSCLSVVVPAVSVCVQRGFAALSRGQSAYVQQPRPSSLLTATAICVPARLNADCAPSDALMYTCNSFQHREAVGAHLWRLITVKVALCTNIFQPKWRCAVMQYVVVFRSLRIESHLTVTTRKHPKMALALKCVQRI